MDKGKISNVELKSDRPAVTPEDRIEADFKNALAIEGSLTNLESQKVTKGAINIGLIADDIRYCYPKTPPSLSTCSTLVHDHVLSHIAKRGDLRCKESELEVFLRTWFVRIGVETPIAVCFDDVIGWQLLCQILHHELPSELVGVHIHKLIDRRAIRQFSTAQLSLHRALTEAIENLHSYRSLYRRN